MQLKKMNVVARVGAMLCVVGWTLIGSSTAAVLPIDPSQGGPAVLDQQTGALAAYSLRRLSTTYVGPAVRVRRSADNTERDFGFSADGTLDVQAVKAFVGTGDGFVTRWYDQSGKGIHLVQAQVSRQPLLVRAGVLFADAAGNPRLRFEGETAAETRKELVSSGPGVLLSNQNLTLFVLQQADNSDEERAFFSLGADKPYNYLQVKTKGSNLHVKLGDGATSTQFSFTSGVTNQSLQILDLSGQKVRAYNSGTLMGQSSHSKSAAVRSQFFVGGGNSRWGPYNGYIAEVILYAALPELARGTIFKDLNGFYVLGAAAAPNEQAILPQAWQWQVDLYDWMETLRRQDVEVTYTPLRWDGSYASAEALADLWLGFKHQPTEAMRSEAKWYVLNDGAGGGIEAAGIVRLPYKGSASNTGAYGSDPAYWYQLDVPLAGGGQGNPYYRNPAVGRRALVISAVEMMMWAGELDRATANARNDFYGKALSSWAYVYLHCKELLDDRTRKAFEAGFERFLEETIRKGALDINTNMDMFFVHGAAIVGAAVENPAVRQKAVEGAKKVLLGYADGELDQKHDVLEGAFFPAGYIGEADGPETTYNGHSFQQLVGALVYVSEDPAWAFLKEIVRRMADFKLHQYFVDLPHAGNQKHFWTGPSGYANRTGGSYVRDQGSDQWRDLSAAALLPEARPLVWDYRFGKLLYPDLRDMAADIERDLVRINGKNSVITDAPPIFRAYSSWPPDLPYFPRGWHGDVHVAVVADDPSVYAPVQRSRHYYNKAFGGAPTGGEFWAYKANDGSQDFSFFVEADAQQGTYSGWYGGKLEAFWTEATGVLILNAHDKTGCSAADKENTKCWDQVATWGAHHVWGRDENGRAFSTADIRSRVAQRTSNFGLGASAPFVEVENVFGDAALSPDSDGEEDGSEIQGRLSVTNRFEALQNGIRIVHRVVSDQVDQAGELWASIPVNLRYNDKEQGGQLAMADAVIEYWDGGAWRALATTLVTTDKIRIGRDYLDGRGARYGYVGFEQAQRVKLSPQAWEQSYQGKHRLRNLQIDLHGSPGMAATLPADRSLAYTITTTEPGAAPTTGGVSTTAQRIDLVPGWQVLARAVVPDDVPLETALADVLAGVKMVKNEAGQIYYPEQDIDEIGLWKAGEAHEVYMYHAATLTLEGQPIAPATTVIPLEAGWNLVPYLLSAAMPVEDAFASIASQLRRVEGGGGQVYQPDGGTGTLKTLQPGQGYWVHVSQKAVLTYPAPN